MVSIFRVPPRNIMGRLCSAIVRPTTIGHNGLRISTTAWSNPFTWGPRILGTIFRTRSMVFEKTQQFSMLFLLRKAFVKYHRPIRGNFSTCGISASLTVKGPGCTIQVIEFSCSTAVFVGNRTSVSLSNARLRI